MPSHFSAPLSTLLLRWIPPTMESDLTSSSPLQSAPGCLWKGESGDGAGWEREEGKLVESRTDLQSSSSSLTACSQRNQNHSEIKWCPRFLKNLYWGICLLNTILIAPLATKFKLWNKEMMVGCFLGIPRVTKYRRAFTLPTQDEPIPQGHVGTQGSSLLHILWPCHSLFCFPDPCFHLLPLEPSLFGFSPPEIKGIN